MTEVKLVKASLDQIMNMPVGPPLSNEKNSLEFIGMVSHIDSENSLKAVNEYLKKEAGKVGAHYIFGVEYRLEGTRILVYGDAYRVRNREKKLKWQSQ